MSKIQELYLSGSLYKNHPCYGVFRDYNHVPIDNGYAHFKSGKQIVVGGTLSNPLDPRFQCLRNLKVPLSSGKLTYIKYKIKPMTEGFSTGMHLSPYIGKCSHCTRRDGDIRKHCMYTTDGKFLCMKK